MKNTEEDAAKILGAFEVKQFAEFLTPEAQAVYASRMPVTQYTLPKKAGGWTTIHRQFLGKVVKSGSEAVPTPEQIAEVAGMFSRAVAEGLVGWGVLCPAVVVPLATIDTSQRTMILVCTFSELTKDELNAALDTNMFVQEGAIPPE